MQWKCRITACIIWIGACVLCTEVSFIQGYVVLIAILYIDDHNGFFTCLKILIIKTHCSKNECTKVQKASLKRCYYECMLLSINDQQWNRASWAFLFNSDSYLLRTSNKISQKKHLLRRGPWNKDHIQPFYTESSTKCVCMLDYYNLRLRSD